MKVTPHLRNIVIHKTVQVYYDVKHISFIVISNYRYLIHEKILINLAFKLIVNGENGKLECVQYPVEEALKLALDQN